MDPSDAADLTARAQTCDTEIRRLNEVIADLSQRSSAVFASWSGRFALSLQTCIDQQMTALHAVQNSLEKAAEALRHGASTPPHMKK